MYKIYLINMPFAALTLPSLSLTQLKSILDKRYPTTVSVEILHLNHDFARYLGTKLYSNIQNRNYDLATGSGDWFFRQSAFPESKDNTKEFFQCYFPRQDPWAQMIKNVIVEKRKRLEKFLDDLIIEYNLEQAQIVGFTSMFAQNLACFAMARKIKEHNSNVITVIGGSNCEALMGLEIIKQIKHIDFVFSGPALKSLPQFVQHCLDGRIEKASTIRGVFSKGNCKLLEKKVVSEQTLFGENTKYANLIGEDFDINFEIKLNYDKYLDSFEKLFPNKNVNPTLLFETSRGCWWAKNSKCTFCGMNTVKNSFVSMGTKIAIEQFKSLLKYSHRCSKFCCIDRIMPKHFIREVFPFLNTPPHVTISVETRPSLSKEDLLVLHRAGVKSLQPGIEALATHSLRLLKKGTDVFQNLLFLMNCITCNIFPVWNLLVGIPGETEDIYKKYVEDIPLLMHLPPPNLNRLRFDRYSDYCNHPKQYGLDLHPNKCYELIYPFSQEVRTNLAYFFVNHNCKAGYIVALNKWIDDIERQITLWWPRWYDGSKAIPPKLFFRKKKKSTVIYDSRSGEVIEHKVGNIGMQVLKHLRKPRSINELTKNLNHTNECELVKEVAYLAHIGVIFCEKERFMSLVLSEEPPTSIYVQRQL